jgi:hypothetical protein
LKRLLNEPGFFDPVKSVTPARLIEKVRRDHEVGGFLLRYAWQNQQAGALQSCVGVVGGTVAGFHTLAVSPPIPCICSVCSRTCGGSWENDTP